MALSRRLFLAILLLGLATAPLGTAHGSCAGPELRVPAAASGPPMLLSGRVVEVEGRHFVDGCDDAGSASVLGCSEPEVSEEVPMVGVRLTLVRGDRRWELGSADAGTGDERADRGHTAWQVRIPAEVRPGPAVLVAATARLRVRVDAVRPPDAGAALRSRQPS